MLDLGADWLNCRTRGLSASPRVDRKAACCCCAIAGSSIKEGSNVTKPSQMFLLVNMAPHPFFFLLCHQVADAPWGRPLKPLSHLPQAASRSRDRRLLFLPAR